MISKDDLDAATHDFINHLRSPRSSQGNRLLKNVEILYKPS